MNAVEFWNSLTSLLYEMLSDGRERDCLIFNMHDRVHQDTQAATFREECHPGQIPERGLHGQSAVLSDAQFTFVVVSASKWGF